MNAKYATKICITGTESVWGTTETRTYHIEGRKAETEGRVTENTIEIVVKMSEIAVNTAETVENTKETTEKTPETGILTAEAATAEETEELILILSTKTELKRVQYAIRAVQYSSAVQYAI
jgi:glutamate racemase